MLQSILAGASHLVTLLKSKVFTRNITEQFREQFDNPHRSTDYVNAMKNMSRKALKKQFKGARLPDGRHRFYLKANVYVDRLA